MTSAAGISVEVTHATSGQWEESVTWQARPSTVLRARTPGAVRWPVGSPAGRARKAVAVTSPEPEVPRVLTAPAQPAADRHFRWGPLPSQPGCFLTARRSGPTANSLPSAPRPTGGHRWAGDNVAPGLGLDVAPSLFPAFSPKSFVLSLSF